MTPSIKVITTPVILEISEPGALWVEPGDLKLISAPLDFLGVKYYNRQMVRFNELLED